MATGKEIYDFATKFLGGKYRLGVLVPKNDASYKGPFDCAEFVAYVIYQKTGRLYGCANDNGNPASADAYTGFLKRDADTIGKIIPVEDGMRIKGAILLRVAANGVIGHTVFSDGNYGTMEANSTKYGLIKSTAKGRRWDIAILPPFIEYDAPVKPEPIPVVPVIYRFTTPLMKSQKIKLIQKALGFTGKSVDGIYGSKTMQAVREFQNSKGLVPDGEVGPITAKALKIIL